MKTEEKNKICDWQYKKISSHQFYNHKNWNSIITRLWKLIMLRGFRILLIKNADSNQISSNSHNIPRKFFFSHRKLDVVMLFQTKKILINIGSFCNKIYCHFLVESIELYGDFMEFIEKLIGILDMFNDLWLQIWDFWIWNLLWISRTLWRDFWAKSTTQNQWQNFHLTILI